MVHEDEPPRPVEQELDDLRLSDRGVIDEQVLRTVAGFIGAEREHLPVEAGIDVTGEDPRGADALEELLEIERGIRHRVPRGRRHHDLVNLHQRLATMR